MVDINWEESPEGTTHVLLAIDGTHKNYWRKVEGGLVFNRYNGRWEKFNDAEVWLKEFADNIVERPLAEPELPDGFRWEDAPEGTTHFLQCAKFGQMYWLKKEGEMRRWKGCKPGEAGLKWPILDGFWPDVYENPAHYLLIERKAGAVAAKKQEAKEQLKPAVKKPVGWWS